MPKPTYQSDNPSGAGPNVDEPARRSHRRTTPLGDRPDEAEATKFGDTDADEQSTFRSDP